MTEDKNDEHSSYSFNLAKSSDAYTNDLSSTFYLNTSLQRFTKAVTESCLEAQRENAIILKSEKEHIQQV